MLSIVYMSSARLAFSDDDLAVLLMNSRVSNTSRGLTGLLVYRDGRFMQLLEGPDAAVVERYGKIAEDPRHTDLLLLNEEQVTERRFPGWSMAYDPAVDLSPEDIPGYSGFLHESSPASTSRADSLLQWFRTHPLADPTR